MVSLVARPGASRLRPQALARLGVAVDARATGTTRTPVWG